MKRLLILATLILSACSTTKYASDSESVKQSPKEMAALYTDLGTTSLENDDLSGAVQSFNTAIQLDPKNATSHNNLGLALLGLGKKDDAKMEFEKAIGLDNRLSDAHVNLGTWYLSKGDTVTARHHYQKALDNLEYKKRFLPMTSIGQIELGKNNLEEAKKWFFQALTENPEYCLAHMLLGHLYEKDDKIEKAAAEYKLSVRGTCVKNAEGLYQLGQVYTRLKEYQKARSQYLLIIENYPNTALAEKASETLQKMP